MKNKKKVQKSNPKTVLNYFKKKKKKKTIILKKNNITTVQKTQFSDAFKAFSNFFVFSVNLQSNLNFKAKLNFNRNVISI